MIGINCGINMVVAPMYLTEIAPVEYRGVFGVLGQLGVVTTILLSQVSERKSNSRNIYPFNFTTKRQNCKKNIFLPKFHFKNTYLSYLRRKKLVIYFSGFRTSVGSWNGRWVAYFIGHHRIIRCVPADHYSFLS